MFKHVILFPIYAIIAFGIFFSSYMVFWFLPYDYFETYGVEGLVGYFAVVVFLIWLIISLVYVSESEKKQ